jgi:hypothetical protein
LGRRLRSFGVLVAAPTTADCSSAAAVLAATAERPVVDIVDYLPAVRGREQLLAVFADRSHVKPTGLAPQPSEKDVPRSEADKEWKRKIACMQAPVE